MFANSVFFLNHFLNRAYEMGVFGELVDIDLSGCIYDKEAFVKFLPIKTKNKS